MPKMTIEIRTDENGYFSKTVRVNPPLPLGTTVHIAATLLEPVATGLWGDVDIDAADGACVVGRIDAQRAVAAATDPARDATGSLEAAMNSAVARSTA